MDNVNDKSSINWFPGHMTKALREMEGNVKSVDLVIYVLDARAPYSCLNPNFKDIIGNKPVIFVLNKSDLADDKETRLWVQYFNNGTNLAIALNSTMTNSSKQIVAGIEKLLSNKLDRNKIKGVKLPLRAMVIGVPNCGKSTLINNLCGKYKAITGNRPSVTRTTQWVKIAGGIELLDTPGTLWPAISNKEVANNLAYINSIRDEVLDIQSLSLDFITKIVDEYPQEFCSRYNLDYDTISKCSALECLQAICERRKFFLSGDFDYERGARAILDDFRKCRIGRITLDNYEKIVME